MATYDEMKTRVGQKLGILPVGVSLSAEDADLIGRALTDVQEQITVLSQLPLLNIEQDTPTEYADPLATITAASLVDEFGIPEPRRSTLLNLGSLALTPPPPAYRLLYKLMTTPQEKLTVTTDVTYV